MPDGNPFEGVGIDPDVYIQPRISDLKVGKDVVLEKAMQLANSFLNEKSKQ